MSNTIIAILVSLVSLVVSTFVFPFVLRYAKVHNIVDNPNARKLQRVPVPVLGGIVVYTGITAGLLLLNSLQEESVMGWGFVAMTIMMIMGIWDDIKDISALLRLIVEIIVVGGFMYLTGFYIDDFHGLWGIHELHPAIAIPLSIVIGVGVINAVNLIDGVDGYASGYCMLACTFFGLMFWSVWSMAVVGVNLIIIFALLPFFSHNVFGIRSKMYIGDGGTLMLGMLMTILLFYSLSSKSVCGNHEDSGIGMAAFTLAVMSIPVFDTLRVMVARIFRGTSPFHPDKTHLHHLFIDMGFSHLGAAMFILLINTMVVLVWFLLWRLGVSIDGQTYMVIFMGLLVTAGFYAFMRRQQNGGPLDEEGYPLGSKIWHAFCKIGEWSHFEKGLLWRGIRWIMDIPLW